MPLAQAGQPCPYCQGQGLRPLERVVRLGVFEDPLKHLVHRMKYNGDWTLAEMLADRLCAHEPARDLLAQADVLVPVPLHPLRQVVRGYNQAQVIAARLVRSAKPRRIAVVWPAARTRDTGSQTRLSSNAQRVQNMRQAFALVRPELVADRHVVLVDDVMTSGATLRSLARALRRGRPKRLSAILLAIADPRGRGFEAI
jgi:ComF family protein